MTESNRRGRPATLTLERLADAGIRIGLPNITMVAIAAELGVSQVALYKYVSGLDALKTLVAEEIFLRWLLPIPLRGDRADLKAYLTPFSLSMWDLVESHAGIAPYMLRRDMITEKMMAKIAAHQRLVADAFGITMRQSTWLLFTIAYHCVAIADTVLPKSAPEAPETTSSGVPSHSAIDADHVQGVDALIIGALATLDTI